MTRRDPAGDVTAPRHGLGEPEPRGDSDLTAVRSDIGVYDPTIPRRALVEDDDTDATVRAPAVRTPQSSPEAGDGATWFVPDEQMPVRATPRHPGKPGRGERDDPAAGPAGRTGERHTGKRREEKGRTGPERRRDRTGDTTGARPASVWLREIAVVVVGAMVLTTLVRTFLFQPFTVPSQSMEETLRVSDKIVVSKAARYRRGDVLVFRDDLGWLPGNPTDPGPLRTVLETLRVVPDSSQQYLVKRVVGLPGDVVECCDKQGNLSINGRPVDETGILAPPAVGQPRRAAAVPFRVTVPADHLFMMGDNRADSADSRCHLEPNPATGFVAEDSVVGPVNLIVAPVSRWTYLRAPEVYADVPDPPGPPPADPRVETEGGC